MKVELRSWPDEQHQYAYKAAAISILCIVKAMLKYM